MKISGNDHGVGRNADARVADHPARRQPHDHHCDREMNDQLGDEPKGAPFLLERGDDAVGFCAADGERGVGRDHVVHADEDHEGRQQQCRAVVAVVGAALGAVFPKLSNVVPHGEIIRSIGRRPVSRPP